MKPTICPTCGYFANAVSSIIRHAQPKPGDVSVCLSCGELNVFLDDMSFRPATAEDWQDLSDEQVTAISLAQVHISERGQIKRRSTKQ